MLSIKNEIEENNQKILEYRKLIHQIELSNKLLEDKYNQMNYQDLKLKLNNQQKNAVENTDNNSIIIACPGSGKTHTLIAKITYLIQNKDIDPNQIILITFTKKASQEMNNRLSKQLPNRNDLYHIGTIHGLAYRTLQKYDGINYTILDEKDSHKCIQTAFKTVMIKYSDKYSADIKSHILKKCIVTNDILTSKYPIGLDEVTTKLKIKEYKMAIKQILNEYELIKRKNRYLDFNDLMIKFLSFLKNKDKSREFRSMYRYILFDEYQDINSIQDLILKEMNKDCQNLTVVGDDAQAIYAFRGSEVKYIINFSDIHQNVEIYKLEKNYRSTPEIINFCNEIIKNNNSQLKKNMVSVKKTSLVKPKISGFKRTKDEINYIINQIKNNIKSGINLSNQVIITRKNRQLDSFELELIKNKINYVKSKGVGLMDRVHIKDFLAFLIVLVNNKSIIHWKRILVSTPGIGNVTLNLILSNDADTIRVVLFPQKHTSKKVANLLNNLSKLFRNLIKLYKVEKYSEICAVVIDYLKPIVKKNMRLKEQTTYEEKISDLKLFSSYITKNKSISDFLVDIHLNIQVDKKGVYDQDKDTGSGFGDGDEGEDDSQEDYLLLSTIHGAKGLEWDYVYLSGMSSDIMPSFKPNIYTTELDDIEEERRLFYVGCSRAKKVLELTLSYDYHFVTNSVYASPFIHDIDNTNSKFFNGINLIYAKRLYKGNVTHIINNYLLLMSSSRIYNYFKTLKYTYKSYYNLIVDPLISSNRIELIYGTFIDNLIIKIIYQNYNQYIDKISIPIYDRYNIKYDTHYFKYIDPNNDWKDCIGSVLRISTKRTRLKIKYKNLFEIITSKKQFDLYNKIEEMLNKIVCYCLKNYKRKNSFKIYPHYNVSYGDIMGEADLVIGDTLIEIKASKECIATTKYVLQTIMYRYMLRKKGLRISKIVLMNPILGEIFILHITPQWKDTFRVYNEVMNL